MKTVEDLMARLKLFDPKAKVRLCMDWSKSQEGPEGQWEDELGGVAYSEKENIVYILNENFK
jgi:hypothetical protein